MAEAAGRTLEGPEVLLRDGEESDLQLMHQLDISCFEPPFRFSRLAMRGFVRARGAFTIVVEGRGRGLVGFVVVQVSGPTDAYVVTLDVREDARRQGIAGRLLRAAEIRAAREGAARIVLHVWTTNEGAIRFYEREGYGQTLRHRGFYKEGMDAFGYAKTITQREAVIQSA